MDRLVCGEFSLDTKGVRLLHPIYTEEIIENINQKVSLTELQLLSQKLLAQFRIQLQLFHFELARRAVSDGNAGLRGGSCRSLFQPARSWRALQLKMFLNDPETLMFVP